MSQWYKCSCSGKSCAAPPGMGTLGSEAVLCSRGRKVSPLLLLTALRTSTPQPMDVAHPALAPDASEVFLPSFFQSNHPAQLPYCAHHHIKLGLVQKNATGPPTNV